MSQSRNTLGQDAGYDGDFNVTEYWSITYRHDVEDQLVGGTIQAINDRLGRCRSEFTGEQRKHVE